MLYAFLSNCYSQQQTLIVAENEQEMLKKLLVKTRNLVSASTLKELKDKLREADYGQGSPGWDFELVEPE